MEIEDRIVTAGHNGMSYPRLVADHVNQHGWLVDALLQEQDAMETRFYVWDKPVMFPDPQRTWPSRWMRIGYHNGFGAALFADESGAPDADWAWLGLAAEPLAEAPTIFYDAPTPVIFPPASVMPLATLRAVILEWCATGQRPGSVRWVAVNEQQWDLDHDGSMIHTYPGQRQTMHYLTGRGEVIREYGWGTDRTAPEPDAPERELTWADHRTGRTAFGTAGPEVS